MRKPEIGLKLKSEIIKPSTLKRCTKCKSLNVVGYGTIIGHGWINLGDMSVEDTCCADEFEVYDGENLSYECRDCDHEWE